MNVYISSTCFRHKYSPGRKDVMLIPEIIPKKNMKLLMSTFANIPVLSSHVLIPAN